MRLVFQRDADGFWWMKEADDAIENDCDSQVEFEKDFVNVERDGLGEYHALPSYALTMTWTLLHGVLLDNPAIARWI